MNAPLVLATVVALMIVAWQTRWVQDDAFISYRYVQNWLEGWGIVWNRGEPVEGYSNFLWIVVLAAVGRAGVDLLTASYVVSILCFGATLLVTYVLMLRVRKDHRLAWLTMTVVGTNYSFFCYSTGGLETQLAALIATVLLAFGAHVAEKRTASLSALFAVSVAAAAAVLTRPDGVIVSVIVAVWIASVLLSNRDHLSGLPMKLLAMTVPALVILTLWIHWKLGFYGDWLPNTYYVKLGIHRPASLIRGAVYVGFFFVSYWILPVLVGLALKTRSQFRRLDWSRHRFSPVLLLIVYIAATLAYIIRTGGDIMEFRFIVPAIPAIVISIMFWASKGTPSLVPLVVAVLIVGDSIHGRFFQNYMYPPGIGFIRGLAANVDGRSTSWSSVGKALHAALPEHTSVKIAVIPAGAVSFFSRLESIDMIGLNDRWVAQHGRPRELCSVCTAHVRIATLDYLNRVGTNLIIGDPQIVGLDSVPGMNTTAILKRMFYDEAMDFDNIPASAKFVIIPLDSTHAVCAVYLRLHPHVEQAIRDQGWRILPLGAPLPA